MKKIWLLLLLVLCAQVCFGQAMPASGLFRGDSDTAIARTGHVRVPTRFQVGGLSDPLSGWNKAQLVAMKITDSSKGNFAGLFWLQIDSVPSGRHTTHALVAETYVDTNAVDTINYYTMVAEFSFNVAGTIRDTSGNGKYLFNTVFNGFAPKVNGSDTGFIKAPNVIYVDINPLDVVSGLFNYCDIDTVYGLRVQQQDNGAIVTYSVWAGDNIHSEDTISTRDQFIVGANGSDSARITPDSLIGFNTIKVDSNEVFVLDARTKGAGYNQSLMRMWNDSVQIRWLFAGDYVTLQIGDSNMFNDRKFLIAGNSNTPLADLELRSQWVTIQNLDATKWRLPRNPGTNGQVLTLAAISGTDSTYWGTPAGGTGWPLADSLARILDSVRVYFVENDGDTIVATGKIFQFGSNTLKVVTLAPTQIFDVQGIYFDSSIAQAEISTGRSTASSTGKLNFQRYSSGGASFYSGTIERVRQIQDSLDGLNRAWLTNWIAARIDSIISDIIVSNVLRADTLDGIDTTGIPTMGDDLDMNGYSILNADSIEVHRLSGDTVRATVYEGLPDSLAGLNEVKALVNDSLDDVRTAVTAQIHDSLNVYKRKKLKSPYHFQVATSDSVNALPNVVINANVAAAKHVTFVDSAGNVAGAVTDTFSLECDFEKGSVIDSLVTLYISSNAANYITEIILCGPDRSDGTNLCDSVYQNWTQDRDATSWTRLPLLITNSITATAGERFAVRFLIYHSGDNSSVKVGWAELGYR